MAFSFKLDTANPSFFTITNKSIHDPLLKIATKRRILGFKVSASSSSSSSSSSRSAEVFEEGQLERPRWSGETPLSRLVGTLISIKPLFSILKLGARQWGLNSTAEKTNIPWTEMTKEILDSDVYKELESIENPAIVYPDLEQERQNICIEYAIKGFLPKIEKNSLAFFLLHSCLAFLACGAAYQKREKACIADIDLKEKTVDYLNPFHAYDEGNLSWLAAAEADAATMSMVRRAIPNASSLEEANQIVRGNWLDAIEKHHQQYSADFSIRDILDIGCSVGVSTGYLADRFPSAKVTGLDLSPYFLSVAQYKEKKRNQRKNPISWIHANGENTGLPSESFDLVSIPYVFHECPERAIRNIVKESFRLLRPGGTIAITDNSPKSKILQELPPVLFTLMKSTEPFLDEYYLTDLERVIKETGFANVQTVLTDPRHRTVTATVPY
uniref:CMV 1a interacting protein 1 n=1 Tax=Solanum tuberosum TaxID=4113 RepID=M1API9_SOLTU